MRIETTCENRKEMVKQIGEYLGEKPKYIGPPSFAYQVGELTIERNGTIVSEVNIEESLRGYLESLGYVQLDPTYEKVEVSVPIEDLDGLGLQNLIYMLKSKQYLLNQVTRQIGFNVDDQFIKRLQEIRCETKEDVIKLYEDFRPKAISGMVIDSEKVTFCFPQSDNPNKNRAYIELAAMMVAHAKEAKRISPISNEPENEKYYLRVWLVRLELDGKGAKETRKALLEGLKGHTAFRTPADAEKHKERLNKKKAGEDNGK